MAALIQQTRPVADEIHKLHDLHEQGILTDAEFAQAKSKLLEQPQRYHWTRHKWFATDLILWCMIEQLGVMDVAREAKAAWQSHVWMVCQ